jgi:hypothetical protein
VCQPLRNVLDQEFCTAYGRRIPLDNMKHSQ